MVPASVQAIKRRGRRPFLSSGLQVRVCGCSRVAGFREAAVRERYPRTVLCRGAGCCLRRGMSVTEEILDGIREVPERGQEERQPDGVEPDPDVV